MKLSRLNLALLIAATALAASCSKASMPKDDGAGEPTVSAPSPGLTPSERADWAAIEQLEAQAKKLAHLEGCASSDDCRSAPVGSRACGGPRYYLAWCAKSTDSVALYRKLEEVAAAERSYNKKYQIISTCEFRMPPIVTASGGSCIAQ